MVHAKSCLNLYLVATISFTWVNYSIGQGFGPQVQENTVPRSPSFVIYSPTSMYPDGLGITNDGQEFLCDSETLYTRSPFQANFKPACAIPYVDPPKHAKFRNGKFFKSEEGDNKIFQWSDEKKNWELLLTTPHEFSDFEVTSNGEILLIGAYCLADKKLTGLLELTTNEGFPKEIEPYAKGVSWPKSLTEALAIWTYSSFPCGDYLIIQGTAANKIYVVNQLTKKVTIMNLSLPSMADNRLLSADKQRICNIFLFPFNENRLQLLVKINEENPESASYVSMVGLDNGIQDPYEKTTTPNEKLWPATKGLFIPLARFTEKR